MSRKKGQALERAFAAWMVSALHYTTTVQREFVKGEVATRPYEVDVHGERYRRYWYALRVVGMLLFVLGMATIFMPHKFTLVTHAAEGIVAKIWPSAASSGILILALVALFVGEFGRKRSTHHAWVECKNRKTAVKRFDIEKLRGAVEDVRKNETASWKPDEVIVVSAAGFDDDAIALADEYGFVCYQRISYGFERV
ncbi:hypothetical protein [Polyangium sorediatum]|uniref:Restriction endonuclease type IV Mrr domain-containing protein n=1 Tax=Polyangium sorediatum TaxID=889274 RepID=A0ABT6P8B4_9BACT|nr:hypothetical protein [Polyangium sorediatum]MDI1436837.1 hypothetical protein [Polyangium sorediatum]